MVPGCNNGWTACCNLCLFDVCLLFANILTVWQHGQLMILHSSHFHKIFVLHSCCNTGLVKFMIDCLLSWIRSNDLPLSCALWNISINFCSSTVWSENPAYFQRIWHRMFLWLFENLWWIIKTEIVRSI